MSHRPRPWNLKFPWAVCLFVSFSKLTFKLPPITQLQYTRQRLTRTFTPSDASLNSFHFDCTIAVTDFWVVCVRCWVYTSGLKLAGINNGLPYASGKRFKANSAEINIWSQTENHKTHNTIILVFHSEDISPFFHFWCWSLDHLWSLWNKQCKLLPCVRLLNISQCETRRHIVMLKHPLFFSMRELSEKV